MIKLNDGILTRNVQAFFITPISHLTSDVRDVSTSVAFSSDTHLELEDPEDFLEVEEEANKIFCNIFFTRGCYVADGEAGSDGCSTLIDTITHWSGELQEVMEIDSLKVQTKDIGEVWPRALVYLKRIHASTPNEQTSFLGKSFQRVAAYEN